MDELHQVKLMRENFPIELVVARYEEDLRWLRRVPKDVRITIFNKGASPVLPPGLSHREDITVKPLQNEGREAHSYLTHIVERYTSLATVTVFCQGHPFDHAPDFHDQLRVLAETRETEPFLWFGFLEETDDPLGKRLFVPWSKNLERKELSTGRLHEELFGLPSPALFHFRVGAQFSVSREAAHRRPIEFYRRALEFSTALSLAAHSYERLWDRIFGDPQIDPTTLGESGVRYLKKIRRLEGRCPNGGASDSV